MKAVMSQRQDGCGVIHWTWHYGAGRTLCDKRPDPYWPITPGGRPCDPCVRACQKVWGSQYQAFIKYVGAEVMTEALGNATFRFWACPIPTHHAVERDGDVACCLFPGCLRRSDYPDRNSCECEVYDCAGGCCGGQCSCAQGVE